MTLHDAAADWARQGRHLPSRTGERVFLRQDGQGRDETVLFLHGFPTWSYDWHRQVEALAPRFHCVCFDFPGFGLSEKRRRPYSVFGQADMAEDVMKAVGASRAVLVAHDYGATVAQILLHRQKRGTLPFRVERVVLLNGGVLPGEHRPLPIQRLMANPVAGPLLSRFVSKKTIRKSFDRIFGERKIQDEELDALWSGIALGGGAAITHRLLGYMQERAENEGLLKAALAEADTPLRFVWGLEDPISGGHVLDALRQFLPNLDAVGLQGVGHYPQIEAPGAVIAGIIRE